MSHEYHLTCVCVCVCGCVDDCVAGIWRCFGTICPPSHRIDTIIVPILHRGKMGVKPCAEQSSPLEVTPISQTNCPPNLRGSQANKGSSKIISSFHDPMGCCSWPEMKMQFEEGSQKGKVSIPFRCAGGVCGERRALVAKAPDRSSLECN